jgi:hypothetical protein
VELAIPVKLDVKLDDVPVRRRGIVVVTVDWNAVDVPDITPGVLIVVVVVVPAAVMGVFVVVNVDPLSAPGRSVPPAASGNRGAAVPVAGDVKG